MKPTQRSWIFDLDNTLYDSDSAFFEQIARRMTEFISQYFDLDRQKALQLQKKYLHQYGTSLSGLMREHNMPPDPFLAFVHDVDVSTLIPQPKLFEAIKALPGRKYVFTNGSRSHAENVTVHLQLRELFDGLFAIEDADYIPKPHAHAFEKFCHQFSINPKQAVFFDDSANNLHVPKQMGMTTILIGQTATAQHASWVDYIHSNLYVSLNSHLTHT